MVKETNGYEHMLEDLCWYCKKSKAIGMFVTRNSASMNNLCEECYKSDMYCQSRIDRANFIQKQMMLDKLGQLSPLEKRQLVKDLEKINE